MIGRLLRIAAVVLALGATAACEKTPDEAAVRDALQGAIGTTFAEPTFEIASFERVGSGPLPAGADGTERKIVYYNADLRLLRDYSFNDWEALNVSALANLLGATEHGLQGIRRDGNAAGDTLRVRGSVGFERTDGDWQPVVVAQSPVSEPPTLDNTGPPAVARGLVDQIMALFEGPPTDDAGQARAIITEELDEAYRQITLRLDRLQRAFVIAGGPGGGEYNLIARTIAATISADGIRSAGVATDGSVENLRLVRDGSADVVLAQNDIAAMAARGEGLYQDAGADPGSSGARQPVSGAGAYRRPGRRPDPDGRRPAGQADRSGAAEFRIGSDGPVGAGRPWTWPAGFRAGDRHGTGPRRRGIDRRRTSTPWSASSMRRHACSSGCRRNRTSASCRSTRRRSGR